MTGIDLLDWAVGALVALAGAFGVWAGARKTLADARATKQPATAYEALERRVIALETSDAEKSWELSRLRSQVRRLAGVLTREVRTVLDWVDAGTAPPPPDSEVDRIRNVIHDIQTDERESA